MAKRKQSEGEELAELITVIQAKYDLSALRALLSGNKQVEAIFINAVKKIAQIGEKTRFSDAEAEFLLKNYPAVKKQVDDALTALHNSLVTTIQSNCEEAWELADAKNDAIVDAIAERTKLSAEQVALWKARNTEAAAEFLKRTDRVFNLSRNIWQITDEFKGEMELALDIGLGEGRSATSLAKEMQKYLKDPDKLFRRVRDKHGNLKLSKNAAAYHPGRGKYRSAYKNALRVTGTEGNIAYRTADYERWQQLDFVEGIEINTSHTNHPVADICDELKGVYPKEFKWTGWHPMCRCNATAKMSDFDAFLAKQQEYIDNGTQPDYSENKVTEMPDNFTKWVNDNESRIAGATSLPYFLADNGKLSKGKYRVQLGRTTQKQGVGNAKLGRAATKEAYKDYEGRGALKLDGELLENANKAAESVGTKRRSDMTWEEADNKNTNPNFKPNTTTADNCQACVVVHEARLRGIDVTALPYNENNDAFVKLGDNFERAWVNPRTNKPPKPMEYHKGGFEQMVNALEKQCSAVGRYHIGLNWEEPELTKEGIKIVKKGHVLTAERISKNIFRYFDPQIGEFININSYSDRKVEYLESIKVDNMLLNIDVFKQICKSLVSS